VEGVLGAAEEFASGALESSGREERVLIVALVLCLFTFIAELYVVVSCGI